MERRTLLKGGLLLGGGLLAEGLAEARLPGPVPAAFFEGQLGDDFAGWLVQLATTGRRVAGIAYDPSSVDRTTPEGEHEPLRGVRLKGSLTRTGFKLKAYNLEDLRQRRRVGLLSARPQNGVLTGGLRLKDRRRGPLQGAQIPIAKESLDFVGQYRGSAVDPAGRTLYTGLLTLTPDLAWELRDIVPADGFPALTAGTRLTGRWGVTADGRAMMSVTQLPAPRASAQSESESEGRQSIAGGLPRRRRPLGAGNPLVFTDSDFPDAEWTALKFREDPPTQQDGFTAARVEQGGNPGAYRSVKHLLVNVALEVAHVRSGWLYARTTVQDPPITNVQFQLDSKLLAVGVIFNGLVVHTPPGGGAPSYYGADMNDQPHPTWVTSGSVGTDPTQFNKVAGPGPDFLDVEALGTYQFGFVSSTGLFQPVSESAIDNLRVEVTLDASPPPPPPPAGPSVEIDGPPVVHLSELLDITIPFVVTVRDPSTGDPLPGVRLGFDWQSPLDGLVHITTRATDVAGRVRFEVTIIANSKKPGLHHAWVYLDDGSPPPDTYVASRPCEVKEAQGFCGDTCFSVLWAALLGRRSMTAPGVGGFCAEHPLLPDHSLCAEPLPPEASGGKPQ
jgi:hypothetical protein